MSIFERLRKRRKINTSDDGNHYNTQIVERHFLRPLPEAGRGFLCES